MDSGSKSCAFCSVGLEPSQEEVLFKVLHGTQRAELLRGSRSPPAAGSSHIQAPYSVIPCSKCMRKHGIAELIFKPHFCIYSYIQCSLCSHPELFEVPQTFMLCHLSFLACAFSLLTCPLPPLFLVSFHVSHSSRFSESPPLLLPFPLCPCHLAYIVLLSVCSLMFCPHNEDANNHFLIGFGCLEL